MMGQLYLIILMIAITAMLLWHSYKINDFNVEGIIFGVRVPSKYREHEKIKEAVKFYKKNITIFTIADIVILLSVYYVLGKVYILIMFIYILIFINIYYCIMANKKLRLIKEELGWSIYSKNKVYVELGNKKSNKVSLNLFYIAALIGILGFLITVIRLPSLSKIVPVHFGVNGPDGWADSTTLSGKLQIVGLPIISLICIWSMAFSAKFQSKKSGTKFNGGTLSGLILKRRYSARALNKMLGLLSIGISLLMFYSTMFVVEILEFTQTENYILMIITIVAIGFPFTYWIYDIKKIKLYPDENKDNEEEIYRDDDKYYIGGIFYFNPDDPSNIVQKRIGSGLDFNYAHVLGKIMIFIEIALLFMPIVLLIIKNI